MQLLDVLRRLVASGNSVVVIEHHLDVIRCSDWIVDLGPEGGPNGGQLVAEGTPERVSEIVESHTGRFLAERLRSGGPTSRAKKGKTTAKAPASRRRSSRPKA